MPRCRPGVVEDSQRNGKKGCVSAKGQGHSPPASRVKFEMVKASFRVSSTFGRGLDNFSRVACSWPV